MKNATSRIKIIIPVKPHLKKYISAQLEDNGSASLNLSAKSAIGAFFFTMLQSGDGKPKEKQDYSCYIVLNIPNRDQLGAAFDGRYTGVEISDVNIGRINEFFELLFNQELFARLDLLKERGEIIRKGGKLKSSILNFLQKFDIEESEMAFETVKKRYQRHCEADKSLLCKGLK